MQLAETASERALADEVRTFLSRESFRSADLPHALDDRMAVLRRWQAACYEAGYVGRAWPSEFGGGGRPPVEQIIVDQELAAAGAPEFVNIVGLDVLGPSLLRFGSDDQRRRYIPPILSAEEIWCQGFSEPEAGSDLASLRTRAVQDGDTFVINGQKTWVSWGQYAGWCGLLARTDDSVPRHRGISMLIVDMSSPGVEVRPMTQITGHAEFSQLFLDDVVVPKENLLGALGDGWKIAMHTLGHERGTAALPRQVTLRTWLDRAVRDAAAQGRLEDPLGPRRGPGQLEREAADGGGRAAPRRERVRALRRRRRILDRDLPVLARRLRLRRHAADPAEHHRRPHPRAAPGVGHGPRTDRRADDA